MHYLKKTLKLEIVLLHTVLYFDFATTTFLCNTIISDLFYIYTLKYNVGRLLLSVKHHVNAESQHLCHHSEKTQQCTGNNVKNKFRNGSLN